MRAGRARGQGRSLPEQLAAPGALLGTQPVRRCCIFVARRTQARGARPSHSRAGATCRAGRTQRLGPPRVIPGAPWAGLNTLCSVNTWQLAQERPFVLGNAVWNSSSPFGWCPLPFSLPCAETAASLTPASAHCSWAQGHPLPQGHRCRRPAGLCSSDSLLAVAHQVDCSSGSRSLLAGPVTTLPWQSKREPWHGQSHDFSAEFQATTPPRCGHVADSSCFDPASST